jgi:hypothetical protein
MAAREFRAPFTSCAMRLASPPIVSPSINVAHHQARVEAGGMVVGAQDSDNFLQEAHSNPPEFN